jgi:putative ABC transport system permease protein
VDFGRNVDVFKPLVLNRANMRPVGNYNYAVIGRLNPGALLESARAELDVLQAVIAKGTPQTPQLKSVVTSLSTQVVGSMRAGLIIVLVVTAAVLISLFVGLAIWLSAHAEERLRELAIRAAVGASRARLAVEATTEALAVVAVAGIGAIGFAKLVFVLLVQNAPADMPRIAGANLDAVAGVWLVVAAGALGAIAAVAGTSIATGDAATAALRSTGAANPATLRRFAAGRRIMAAEATLSAAIAVIAVLLLQSYLAVNRIDKGFTPNGAVAISVSLPGYTYRTHELRFDYYRRALESVERLSGIAAAGVVSNLPLSGDANIDTLSASGPAVPEESRPTANVRYVGGDYFKAIGISGVEGDTGFLGHMLLSTIIEQGKAACEMCGNRTATAVVSERTAATLWPNQPPEGAPLIVGAVSATVAGVVKDVRHELEKKPELTVYLPLAVVSPRTASIVVRTARLNERNMLPSIISAIRSVDVMVPIVSVDTFDDIAFRSTAWRRYHVTVISVLSTIALVSTGLGIYGVLTLFARKKMRETAIRLALGAQRSTLLLSMARHELAPVTLALCVGTAIGIVSASQIGSLLFGVSVVNGAMVGAVLLSQIALVALASYWPLSEVTKQNVVETLRGM